MLYCNIVTFISLPFKRVSLINEYDDDDDYWQKRFSAAFLVAALISVHFCLLHIF